MATKGKALAILKIEVLSSQTRMNHEKFEALIASSMFERLPKEIQEFFPSIMSVPTKTVNAGEVMTTEGAAPEVAMETKGVSPEIASFEVPVEVPKSLRSPRLRPTLTKEGPKMKKDKEKVTLQVRALPKKHSQKESLPHRRRAR